MVRLLGDRRADRVNCFGRTVQLHQEVTEELARRHDRPRGHHVLLDLASWSAAARFAASASSFSAGAQFAAGDELRLDRSRLGPVGELRDRNAGYSRRTSGGYDTLQASGLHWAPTYTARQ